MSSLRKQLRVDLGRLAPARGQHRLMPVCGAVALKKARIVGFPWHDLRHTFASRLVMAGVDIRTVQVDGPPGA